MANTATTRAEPVEGTIVFTDIVGFTEFTATRGDADALQLLATQDRLLSSAMSDGARVVKELGDGLLLLFPEPVTALHTAFALRRGFGDESAASGLAVGIRVGMHHGTALQRGEDIIGHDVNVAARIVDVAAPGEVLVSDALRRRVDPASAGVRFEELGPVVMKGIPEPVRLWRAEDVFCP
jgi:adenylate cyclase